MHIPRFSKILPIVEAVVALGGAAALAIFVPVAGPALCGLALSVLSFREYSFQREVLKGENENTAISVGYTHVMMCSYVFISLMLLSPLLGPVAPVIPGLWMSAVAISIVSALCAGGYEKLRKDWKKSGFRPLMFLIDTIDAVLELIPNEMKSDLSYFFGVLHHWIGVTLFAAQGAIFTAIAAVISPAIGIAGLSYYAMNYLRANNYLPQYIAKPLERLSFWTALVSGVFIPNALMRLYSFYNAVSTFISKIAFPSIIRVLFGKNADLLQSKDNKSTTTTKSEIVPRNIKLDNFDELLSKMPSIQQIQHRDGAEGDIKRLTAEFKQYYTKHPKLAARQASYDSFQKLATTPGILNKVKYYLGYIPMNLSWHLRSIFYYPRLPNNFLSARSQANAWGININQAPYIVPQAPDIDFDGFLKTVSTSIVDSPANMRMFKANIKNSPKFSGVSPEYKTKVEDYGYENATLLKLKKELSALSPEAYQNKVNRVITATDSRFLLPQEKAFKKIVQGRDSILTAQQQVIKEVEQAIASNDKLIADCDQILVSYWKQHLKLSLDATDDEVFEAYLLKLLKDICEQVRTGSVGWEKSIASINEWQNISRHVFAYILKLIHSNEPHDIDAAHEIISNIVMDTGDYCAQASYDIMLDLYKQHILCKVIAAAKLPVQDLMALNMQWYRKTVFDGLYHIFKENEYVRAIFFHMDFNDRHDYAYIIYALKALDLDSNLSMRKDLSSENTDLLKELTASLVAFTIAQLLTACEQGYSPEGILSELFEQIKNPLNNQYPKEFDAANCVLMWADTFENYAVRHYIKTHLKAGMQGRNSNIQELLILMLMDTGCIKLQTASDIQDINMLLERAAQQRPDRVINRDTELNNAQALLFSNELNMSRPFKVADLDSEMTLEAPDNHANPLNSIHRLFCQF